MRVDNWHGPLEAFIESRRFIPFQWGTQDCCAFAAGAVHAVTGLNFLKQFPAYSSAREAAQIMKKYGGVRSIADAALEKRTNVNFAQRGDVVLVNGLHGETLAVCTGAEVVAPGSNGLVFVPMAQTQAAWMVR